jgi:nitrite reductase/ring-hydroxylating ferredoxin subunit
MSAPLVAITENDVVRRRLGELARAMSLSLASFTSVDAAETEAEPAAVVVDLGVEGAIEAARLFRARWAHTLIAGFVSLPERTLWESARAAGYDLVATRGAIATQLREALTSWKGPPTRARMRLVDSADVVGRLGVVARFADTPVGPVALYRVGNRLYAAADVCPHAGARLSEGELEGTVITCPRHGSRFDIATGERLRGPADEPIPTHPVVVEDGVAFMEID